MPKDLQNPIQFLQSNNFKTECPNCSGKMDLSETAFIDAENFTPESQGLLKERNQFNRERTPESHNNDNHVTNFKRFKINVEKANIKSRLQDDDFMENQCYRMAKQLRLHIY